MKARPFLRALLAALLLPGIAYAQVASETAQEGSQAMHPAQQAYGKPNPNAPPELSQFAFLIGRWRCDARIKGEDGAWQPFQATWVGRYILDGYVIADEFRMTAPDGKLVMLGQNYRSYNSEKKAWVLKWQEALTATWLDLGPAELGGVQVTDNSITYQAWFLPDVLHRMSYLNISADHFTWRGEASTDGGKTWAEIMVIEAYRSKD